MFYSADIAWSIHCSDCASLLPDIEECHLISSVPCLIPCIRYLASLQRPGRAPVRAGSRGETRLPRVPKSKVWSFGDDDDRHPGLYHILHLNILSRYFPFDTYSEVLYHHDGLASILHHNDRNSVECDHHRSCSFLLA